MPPSTPLHIHQHLLMQAVANNDESEQEQEYVQDQEDEHSHNHENPQQYEPSQSQLAAAALANPGEREAMRQAARDAFLNQLRSLHIAQKYMIITSLIRLTSIIICLTFLGLYWNEKCQSSIQTILLFYIVYSITKMSSLIHQYRHNITNDVIDQHPRIKRLKYWLEWFQLGWIIGAGSVFYNETSNCPGEAPHLYKLGTSMLSVELFFLLLPWGMCMLACMFLPCLYCLVSRLSPKNGVRQEIIDGLETRVCERVDPDRECSICIAQYQVGDKIRILPCDKRHEFHCDCIDTWLRINSTCPICREVVNGLSAVADSSPV